VYVALGLIAVPLILGWLFGWRVTVVIGQILLVLSWFLFLAVIVKIGQITGYLPELPIAVGAFLIAAFASLTGWHHVSRVLVVLLIVGLGYEMLHSKLPLTDQEHSTQYCQHSEQE
jgi:hypothetical protein